MLWIQRIVVFSSKSPAVRTILQLRYHCGLRTWMLGQWKRPTQSLTTQCLPKQWSLSSPFHKRKVLPFKSFCGTATAIETTDPRNVVEFSSYNPTDLQFLTARIYMTTGQIIKSVRSTIAGACAESIWWKSTSSLSKFSDYWQLDNFPSSNDVVMLQTTWFSNLPFITLQPSPSELSPLWLIKVGRVCGQFNQVSRTK